MKPETQELLVKNTNFFSEKTLETLNIFAPGEYKKQNSFSRTEGNLLIDKVIVSILFTGTVYGEYVLAIDKSSAVYLCSCMGESSSQNQHEEFLQKLGEILNLIVGQSVTELNNSFEKLTITAPKVVYGTTVLPKIQTGHVGLGSKYGNIECLLYIDQMKLDITESYKSALSSLTLAHNELKQAMKKLEIQQDLLVQLEKQSALGTMAAGVAHEINTPLATIKLLGDHMKSVANRPDKTDLLKDIEAVESTIKRISKITNNLRIFAKGLAKEPFELVSLKEIFKNALGLCEEIVKRNEVQLSYPQGLDNFYLECRPAELTTVFYSILTNSCEAIENLKDKWIRIEINQTKSEFIIYISDSGYGIDKALHKKIFDPFFTTKEFGKGPGLGLSVSKSILEDHAGSIDLIEEKQNTTFRVVLPKFKMKMGV